MKISYIKEIFNNIEIVREGNFNLLGLPATKYKNTDKVLGFLYDSKYLNEFLDNKNMSCVICNKEISKKIKENNKKIGICVSSKPKVIFFKFHNYLAQYTQFYGKSYKNKISSTAKISDKAIIANNDVKIGKNVIIEPNVTILENVEIGSNSIIRAGTVIGSEGYQFVKDSDEIINVKHAGNVVIGNNVEIQSNTCVDKGIYGNSTIIEEHSKIDNLVHIAHNVKIGKRSMVVANAMVAGRVKIGDDVWVGPSVKIRNGLTIKDGASLSMGAVVTKDVESDKKVTGNFAIEHDKFISFIKSMTN